MLDPLRDFPLVRDGYRKGIAEGRVEGAVLGKAEGVVLGKAEGVVLGKAESVLTILKARGIRVSRALREKVLSCSDAELLERWLIRAASATIAADVLGAP